MKKQLIYYLSAISIMASTVTFGGDGISYGEIFRLDLKTGEIKQITHTPNLHEFNPSVSNDGKFVVSDLLDENYTPLGVAITEVATGQQTLLNGAIPGADNPDWSPNGKYITMVGGNGGNYDMVVLPAEGGTPVFTRPLSFTTRFSPNSQMVVTTDLSDYLSGTLKADLISVDISSGEDHIILEDNAGQIPHYPNWSPNGQMVAFAMYEGANASGPSQIYVKAVDQAGNGIGSVRQMTFASDLFDSLGLPDWSNDSKKIIFTAGVNGNSKIYSVDLVTREINLITAGVQDGVLITDPFGNTFDGGPYDAAISNDGQYLYFAEYVDD